MATPLNELSNFGPINTAAGILSFVLGAMIGSFLNVCVYRMPRGESVVKPRSHCPKCGNLIAWYDNLPLLSWLILRAKCRHCGLGISIKYPALEALTGFLFLLVFWRFGFVAATPIYMVFVASMVLVTFIDLTDWTIPNEVTFPGIPAGLLLGIIGMFFPGTGLLVTDIFDALIGMLIGGGSLYLLDKISLVLLKKRGMGFGDVKLLAMIGAFLGWKSVLMIIMLSSTLGSIVGVILMVVGKRMHPEPLEDDPDAPSEEGNYLPFGPYLALSGVIMLFCGNYLIDLYRIHVLGMGPSAGLPL